MILLIHRFAAIIGCTCVMCTPMSYAGSAPDGYDDTCVTHVSTYPLTLVFGRKKTYTPMSCAGQPVLCSSVFAVLL
jgi:hypothetical protein